MSWSARLPLEASVHSKKQSPIAGVLVVRVRGAGPVVFAKRRDGDRRQVMRRLGPAWVVPMGDANAKPGGARIGDFVERRGRAPESVLDVRRAHDEMRRAIDRHEAEVQQARRRAARVRETGVTVRRAAAAWPEDGRTDREWKHSTAHDCGLVAARISRVLGDRPLDAITEDELRAFLSSLRPARGRKTLEHDPSVRVRTKYTLALRAMFRIAEDRGWIEASPAERLRTPRRRRKSKNHPLRREEYLTPEDVHALIRAAQPDDGVFFPTLAFAGLRLGEALALEWQDVDFARSSLHVERSRTRGVTGTPKGGGGRTVPMAGELAQALAAHGLRTRLSAGDGLVFVGKRGDHVDAPRLRERYYGVQAAIGIQPRRTLHQLRHTFATVCASHGIPLRTIQGWCGHEDYSTTERYAHFMPRHEDAALVSAAFAPMPATPREQSLSATSAD
jgi:integrase